MTTLQALLLFTAAAGLLTVTPGLDTLLVLRTAIADGAQRALFAAAGICAGCMVWGLLVAFGLGALFAVSTLAYEVLRYAGAAYLLWLGAHLLRRPRARLERAVRGRKPKPPRCASLCSRPERGHDNRSSVFDRPVTSAPVS